MQETLFSLNDAQQKIAEEAKVELSHSQLISLAPEGQYSLFVRAFDWTINWIDIESLELRNWLDANSKLAEHEGSTGSGYRALFGRRSHELFGELDKESITMFFGSEPRTGCWIVNHDMLTRSPRVEPPDTHGLLVSLTDEPLKYLAQSESIELCSTVLTYLTEDVEKTGYLAESPIELRRDWLCMTESGLHNCISYFKGETCAVRRRSHTEFVTLFVGVARPYSSPASKT
jgi:hypothetical protein